MAVGSQWMGSDMDGAKCVGGRDPAGVGGLHPIPWRGVDVGCGVFLAGTRTSSRC